MEPWTSTEASSASTVRYWCWVLGSYGTRPSRTVVPLQRELVPNANEKSGPEVRIGRAQRGQLGDIGTMEMMGSRSGSRLGQTL